MNTKLILVLILTSSFLLSAYGGSATWNVNPSSNDWNTALNWTPHTVPNGPSDIATFPTSNMASPVIHSSVELDALVFGDSTLTPFTIMIGEAGGQAAASLTLSGTGITNNSDASIQALQATPTLATNGASNSIILRNNATLPGQGQAFCFLTALGAVSGGLVGGEIQFFDNALAGFAAVEADKGQNGGGAGQVSFFNNSSAGEGQVVNIAGAGASASGVTMFHDQATAGSATVTNYAATTAGIEGGTTFFLGSSTADNSVIFAYRGTIVSAGAGTVIFSDAATAGNSILDADGESIANGTVQFLADSSGGTAHLLGNGDLSISDHNPPGISIGSIEGGGNVFLGSNELTVGIANSSRTYFGVIQGSGSLVKTGTGILTLSGPNTYSGGTTIAGGALRVLAETGSATGTGPVNLNSGSFGGRGGVTGAVTVGTGTGPGAILQPALGLSGPGNLVIQSQLTFKGDSDYQYKLNTKRGVGDEVVARGITIESGAQFAAVRAVGNKKLTAGTVLLVLCNTTSAPIAGTFANLPDHSTEFVGNNSFQVSYEGGDGNDLTFTVL